MKLLLQYLKNYKWLVVAALLLATVNQVFSLLDPWIFGEIVDRFANSPTTFDNGAPAMKTNISMA